MAQQIRVDTAIVGGGFAGAVAAAQLLAGGMDRLALIERRGALGRGVAYGTTEAAHLLNLPAGEMSAWPDDPGHFARWLGVEPGCFAPRSRYGDYVEAVLQEAARARPGALSVVADEAVGLLPEAGGFRLRLRSGGVVMAGRVVLAIGQFPPAPLRLAEDAGWYVEDPWAPEAFAPLPDGEALLVGTGLTAVDVALSLIDRGARRVTMVSRQARLPAAQYEGPAYRDWLDPAAAPARVLPLMAMIRAEIRRSGADWRAVIDALKPHVPALWARLPWVERRRFLRHARRAWESARHRLPPPTAHRVAALEAEGRLVVVAGRLREVQPEGAGAAAAIAMRGGGTRMVHADRVVNCTGPDALYRRISHPLVLDLIGTGLARPDPLGLGLDTAPDGRLKDEDGLAGRAIYTLGWPRQGQLYEATTVPSLREQARDVAARLLT